MTKLSLYLATRGLPLEGTCLKVKQGDEELGITEVQTGPGATYEKTFQVEEDGGGIWVDVCDAAGASHCLRSFGVDDILSANKCKAKAKALPGGGFLVAHLSSATSRGELKLALSGEKLKNLDGLFGKSDPFFVIMAHDVDKDGWILKHRSETVKNDLSPDWKECSINLIELCEGKLDTPLRVIVFDEDEGKTFKPERDEHMGSADTNVLRLLADVGGGEMPVIRKGKQCGSLVVRGAELVGYSNPAEMAGTILDVAGRIEAAKLGAEEGEKVRKAAEDEVEERKNALEEAEEALKEKSKALEEAQAAVEEAEAALEELDLGE